MRRQTSKSPSQIPLGTSNDVEERKRQRPNFTVLLQRRGLHYLNPRLSYGFAVFAVLFMIGVHFILFEALQKTQRIETQANSTNTLLLTPLRYPTDYDHYTIRINSWKREGQLQVSLKHYQTCEGVAEIQVVWCTAQGSPPSWLQEIQANGASKVVIESHELNSLNERFRVLKAPTTAAILSMDDDVLRPCLALDAGFRKWTQHPSRMVGYDARTHVVDETGRWSYGYLSTTNKSNRYSLSLTRFCFLHVDYLHSYFTGMPGEIRDRVEKHMNCEDLAMTLWISSQTNGQVPLLAHYWAIQTQVKLYSPATISGSSGHKRIRDECVEDFSNWLDLKGKLEPQKWVHSKQKMFDCGVDADPEDEPRELTPRLADLEATYQRWKTSPNTMHDEIAKTQQAMAQSAFEQGLIEGTEPWRQRFEAPPKEA